MASRLTGLASAFLVLISLVGCNVGSSQRTTIVNGEVVRGSCLPLPEVRQRIFSDDDGVLRLTLQRACTQALRTPRTRRTVHATRDDVGGKVFMLAGVAVATIGAMAKVIAGIDGFVSDLRSGDEPSSDDGDQIPTSAIMGTGAALVGTGLLWVGVADEKLTTTNQTLTPERTSRSGWLPEPITTPVELETPWGARLVGAADEDGVHFLVDWAAAGALTRQQLAGIYKLHGAGVRPVWMPGADDLARLQAALQRQRDSVSRR